MTNTFERQLTAALPKLTRYARQRASDSAAAEDAVQDAVVRALRVRPIGPLEPWLMAALKYTLIDQRRAVRRMAYAGAPSDYAADQAAPDCPHRALEVTEAFAAVQRLPPAQYDAVMARAFSLREPGARDTPSESNRTYRARLALREHCPLHL